MNPIPFIPPYMVALSQFESRDQGHLPRVPLLKFLYQYPSFYLSQFLTGSDG